MNARKKFRPLTWVLLILWALVGSFPFTGWC